MNPRLRQLLVLAREFPFVATCVAVAVFAIATAAYLQHQQSELQFTHDRVRREGEAMIVTIKSASTLRNERTNLEAALAEINANLVAEDNLAENLGYFYKIEDQTHARITDLHQNSACTANGNRFKVVPVALNITGGFAQVSAFLRQVETGPRLIKVSSFSFHRLKPTGDSVTLELGLEMLAHP